MRYDNYESFVTEYNLITNINMKKVLSVLEPYLKIKRTVKI